MTVLVEPRVLGRYLFFAPIASGGMATVYLGRMAGPKGFSRVVAIKQLHAQLVHDADFVTMFVDEAHLIGRIHHSNVVAPIDVVEADGELCIVMEYVHGEALGRLMRLSRQERIPLRVVTAVMVQTLLGLHAAHEVTDGDGQPLSIVHRDVSPQNILVGEDGITRVVDFGIAKVAYRSSQSDAAKLKGKLGYMAPEQFTGGAIDRRCDVFSAGIILWEMLTGKKLFATANGPSEAAERMRQFEPRVPSSIVPALPRELDEIALKALSVEPTGRFANAHDMARALESACPPAGAIEVAEWVTRLVGDALSMRAKWISDLVALDLSEWTQTYVSSAGQDKAKSLPPPVFASTGLATTVEERSYATRTGSKTLPFALPTVAVFLLVIAVGVAGFAWRSRVIAPSNQHATFVFAASPRAADGVSIAAVSSVGKERALLDAPIVTSQLPSDSAIAPNGKAPQPDASVVTQPSSTGRVTGSGLQSDCRVPYVIDAKRIKRFRPECFR